MAARLRRVPSLALVVIALVAACQADRRPGDPESGWAWFTGKREAHPLMRKMEPRLAAEWWQSVERQPLWPGRTEPFETDVAVEPDGRVLVEVVVDDLDAWRQLAPSVDAQEPGAGSADVEPPPPASHCAPALPPVSPRPRREFGDTPVNIAKLPRDPSAERPSLESEPTARASWTVVVRVPLRSLGAMAQDSHVMSIEESLLRSRRAIPLP